MLKKSEEKTPPNRTPSDNLYRSFSEVRRRFRHNLVSLENTLNPRELSRVSRSKLLTTLHHKKLQLVIKSSQKVTLMTKSSCLRRRALRTQEHSPHPTKTILNDIVTGEIKQLQAAVSRKQKEIEKVNGELKALDSNKLEDTIKKMHEKIRATSKKCRPFGVKRTVIEPGDLSDDELREMDFMKQNSSLLLGIREQESYHKSLEKKISDENSKISVNLNNKIKLKQQLNKG